MSTERDELVDEIAGHPIGSGYYSTSVVIDEAGEMADAVLAAGYRKPQWSENQFVLEISAEGYPRNVGPFPTRAAAEAWMEGRKLTGSWNVFPLACPDAAAGDGA